VWYYEKCLLYKVKLALIISYSKFAGDTGCIKHETLTTNPTDYYSYSSHSKHALHEWMNEHRAINHSLMFPLQEIWPCGNDTTVSKTLPQDLPHLIETLVHTIKNFFVVCLRSSLHKGSVTQCSNVLWCMVLTVITNFRWLTRSLFTFTVTSAVGRTDEHSERQRSSTIVFAVHIVLPLACSLLVSCLKWMQ
jgi:hypothetical protein